MTVLENHNLYAASLPAEQYQLGYNNAVIIDAGLPLVILGDEGGERNMRNCKILADVRLEEQGSNTPIDFSVIEVDLPRKSTGKIENVLVLRRVRTDAEGQKFYADEDRPVELPPAQTTLGELQLKHLGLPVRLAEKLWVGRSDDHQGLYMTNMSDKATMTTTISPGALKYTNTKQGAFPAPTFEVEPQEEFEAEYTMDAKSLARSRGLYNPDTNMFGKEGGKLRAVIDRDTPGTEIDGMVDIRGWLAGDEALVVDSTEAEVAPIYAQFLEGFKDRVRKSPEWTEDKILDCILETVKSAMSYDLGFVDKMSDLIKTQPTEQRKVNLAYYLAEKKGVCRQMGLAAAWLGGEAKKVGLLKGDFTAEVNKVYTRGGHEWGRYTPLEGEPSIVDPAQDFVGTLSRSLQDNANGQNRWEYFRPGEKRQYQAKHVSEQALKHSSLIDTVPRSGKTN